MSTFEDSSYRWRETYFVMFRSARRPTLHEIERALKRTSGRFELRNLSGTPGGAFESVTLVAPDEHAALDISYLEGDEVLVEGQRLVKEMRGQADKKTLERVAAADARLDVLHFEELPPGAADDEDLDEAFDPSALLLVLETLTELTGGVSVDPQSGEVV